MFLKLNLFLLVLSTCLFLVRCYPFPARGVALTSQERDETGTLTPVRRADKKEDVKDDDDDDEDDEDDDYKMVYYKDGDFNDKNVSMTMIHIGKKAWSNNGDPGDARKEFFQAMAIIAASAQFEPEIYPKALLASDDISTIGGQISSFLVPVPFGETRPDDNIQQMKDYLNVVKQDVPKMWAKDINGHFDTIINDAVNAALPGVLAMFRGPAKRAAKAVVHKQVNMAAGDLSDALPDVPTDSNATETESDDDDAEQSGSSTVSDWGDDIKGWFNSTDDSTEDDSPSVFQKYFQKYLGDVIGNSTVEGESWNNLFGALDENPAGDDWQDKAVNLVEQYLPEEQRKTWSDAIARMKDDVTNQIPRPYDFCQYNVSGVPEIADQRKWRFGSKGAPKQVYWPHMLTQKIRFGCENQMLENCNIPSASAWLMKDVSDADKGDNFARMIDWSDVDEKKVSVRAMAYAICQGTDGQKMYDPFKRKCVDLPKKGKELGKVTSWVVEVDNWRQPPAPPSPPA